MRVGAVKIGKSINKVAEMIGSDKQVPGIMLDLVKIDEVAGALKICYCNGHKAVIDEIKVTLDEGDLIGKAVVEYEQLTRVISTCQPSGSIKIPELQFKYLNNNIIRVIAKQEMELKNSEGEVVGTKQMGNKQLDLRWSSPDSSIKTKALLRVDYDAIFTGDSEDEYVREELVKALNKVTVEKSKTVYVSANMQEAFVANQSYATSVPISRLKELTEEDKQAIKAELEASGTYTQENFTKRVEMEENRIHTSVVLDSGIAKSVSTIFGKSTAEKMYVRRYEERFYTMYVDTDDEKTGVWFEASGANKAHLDTVRRFESYNYMTYQLTFYNDFISDAIKSALNNVKSDKAILKFEKEVNEETGRTEVKMVINGGSAAASIADVYNVTADEYAAVTDDIETKEFGVSLKTISDMLAQLKTPRVAFDFEINQNGVMGLRMSEVDTDKYYVEYTQLRASLNLDTINPDTGEETHLPTPVEERARCREKCLMARQFTMLAK